MNRLNAVSKPLKLQRFSDAMWLLLDDISWKPSSPEQKEPEVIAPRGFVTDLASIPRAFWSLLPRDGDYIYGAIIHDYLYWEQPTNIKREDADLILKFAMQDFGVPGWQVNTIYEGVRAGGGGPWKSNAEEKCHGEKRTLVKFPESPTISWANWKKTPGVFAEQQPLQCPRRA